MKWKLNVTDEGQRKDKEKVILLSWSFAIQNFMVVCDSNDGHHLLSNYYLLGALTFY